VSFEAVKLPGGRRVAHMHYVISGGYAVVNDVIRSSGNEVIAGDASTRLCDGVSVSRHDASLVDLVAGGRPAVGRTGAVVSGGRPRCLGESKLLQDASFDGLDASTLQQEPF